MTEATQITSSWASLNLSEVNTDPQPTERTEVPGGTYTFRLAGAKMSPFENQVGSTDIDLVITEGPQAKRHVFVTLPPPNAFKWVVPAAAVLVKRLGGEQLPGEELHETLSRIASNGANHITADIEDNFYTDKLTGKEKQGRPKLRYFSIQAA